MRPGLFLARGELSVVHDIDFSGDRSQQFSVTKEARMDDKITPTQFLQSEGVDDWRVLGDGANAYFRTGSYAAGARLVQAISELPGVDDLLPDVDVRHDGVTVRMVAFIEGYGGMLRSHVELARKISAAARKLGLSADPSAGHSPPVIPRPTARPAPNPVLRPRLRYRPPPP